MRFSSDARSGSGACSRSRCREVPSLSVEIQVDPYGLAEHLLQIEVGEAADPLPQAAARDRAQLVGHGDGRLPLTGGAGSEYVTLVDRSATKRPSIRSYGKILWFG